MVFSFFRKKDSDADTGMNVPDVSSHPAVPAAKPATSSAQHQDDVRLQENDPDGLFGIEVSNGDSQLSPAEEQAAILHANGGTAAAIPVLQAELLEVQGQRRLETWLMLFELYQQKGDRSAFDKLGLEFVVEFEKTPPIWHDHKTVLSKQVQAAGNVCLFGSKLTADTVDKDLTQFRAAAAKVDGLRLDFSRVKEIDSTAAAEVLATWQLTKKVVAPRQVLGGVSFVQLLSSKIETGRQIPAEAPFWLLLIELYQALGQHEEFENLAVEYAITFEVSPPSWDVRFAPKAADKAVMEAAQKVSVPRHEGLVVSGEITSQHSQGLVEIREYAQHTSGEVLLDFEYVSRVDFESAGQFLNLFMDYLQQGRQVRIVQVNELVLALLRLMGIGEMVSLERRKS